jgi:hypothetical protein
MFSVFSQIIIIKLIASDVCLGDVCLTHELASNFTMTDRRGVNSSPALLQMQMLAAAAKHMK